MSVPKTNRTRILKADVGSFGPSPNCPKCRAFRDKNTKLYDDSEHTKDFRLRFYRLMEERGSTRTDVDRTEPNPPRPHPTPRQEEDRPPQSARPEPADHPQDDLSTPMEADEPSYDNVDQDVLDDEVLADLIVDDQPDDDASARQYGMDIDMLLSLGVSPIDATRFVRKCMAVQTRTPSTLIEAYGRGGLSEMAEHSNFNVKGLHALDLVNKKANG